MGDFCLHPGVHALHVSGPQTPSSSRGIRDRAVAAVCLERGVGRDPLERVFRLAILTLSSSKAYETIRILGFGANAMLG